MRFTIPRTFALPLVALASLLALAAKSPPVNGDKELSIEIATLFRAARAVVSDNQALINDPDKGDKGLAGENVVEMAKQNYQKVTGQELLELDDGSLASQSRKAMLEAIQLVMDDAQPLINEPGKGFKGFLPAVFAKLVATEFSRSMDGKMFIKLTAPKSYVRNRSNRPDEWEHNIIETKFKSEAWEHGKTFEEVATHKGSSGFRLILPEYYKESCLGCHGGPKGALDITGGKKEGGKLAELGGAISIVIYQ